MTPFVMQNDLKKVSRTLDAVAAGFSAAHES
jgi:hypothetical protein